MASDSKDGSGRSASAERKLAAEREGAKAWAAYEAEADAVRKRTAKLRELRLAKEAADREAAEQESAAKPAKRAGKAGAGKAAGAKARGAKTKAKPAEKLADWLSAQRREGRRS